tara:strand:- start:185 stop:514 length:330 start_codon:yes stop_codon:yes gene_type:complete
MMSNEQCASQHELAINSYKLTKESRSSNKDNGRLSAKERRKDMLGRILTPHEKRVISLRFGIGTDNTLTLEEVGKSMGLTRERIRQIEQKALNKLRDHPSLKFLKDYLD